MVNSTTTVNAIAIEAGATSPTASSTIQIDPTTVGIPRTGLYSWLKADLGVLTSGANVTQWTDVSQKQYKCNSVESNSPTKFSDESNQWVAGRSLRRINFRPAISIIPKLHKWDVDVCCVCAIIHSE